ncbi:hypothetical protein EV421DRAFT_1919738 [Armillaria borealis]|uniref:Uncharacterized protein n=1 Tax=Armillaria borealis TaxID=47425 RepID=A0AA39K7W6_9AGAR|nr:hypothetical protein EV421DRAFT_1919738 [Armillaria borealis]
MQTGSDTDTDLDGETCLSSRSPSPSHSRLGLIDVDDARSLTDEQSVPDAIAVLQAIDVNLISADDENMHEVIAHASNIMLRFLDEVKSRQKDIRETYLHLTLVLQPSFLRTLFAHRTVFHHIAVSSAVHATSTIVCWVDILLVKLADAIIMVAGDGSQLSGVQHSEEWHIQREDDNLRAASQLPSQWDSVKRVLTSKQASPAAKRLALRLIFGACIILPSLGGNNDRRMTQSEDFLEIIQTCIHQTVMSGFTANYSSDPAVELERINFSMLVSLYVAAETEQQEKRLSSRPLTLGYLLDLVQVVMHPDDAVATSSIVTPPDVLDVAQTILVRWGDTIFWSWETWDDSRIANTEVIVFLTAVWINKFNESLDVCVTGASCESSRTTLNYLAASSAILNVLHHCRLFIIDQAELAEGQSLPVYSLLSKACRTVVHFLHGDILYSSNQVSLRGDLCKTLFSLFVIVDTQERTSTIRTAILEALTLFNLTTLRQTLKDTHQDNGSDFMTSDNPMSSKTAGNMNEIKLTLEFLTVLWHCKALGNALYNSISSVLSSIIDYLYDDNAGQNVALLRGAALTIFSILENDPRFLFKNQKQEILWKVALDAGTSDLHVACECAGLYLARCDQITQAGFAYYVLTTDRLPDPVSCAEAWDYFRDVLLLIFRRHFCGEDGPLSLLLSPVLCMVLLQFLNKSGPIVRFIVSSPWTMTLNMDLKMLMDQDAPAHDDYRRVLRERIGAAGKALMEEIQEKLGRKVSTRDKANKV